MNLQSGTYYWPTTMSTAPRYPSLNHSINCDLLIVGGGSSGSQCAYYFAETGMDVVLIEKGDIGQGSTATNTSILQYMGEKLFTDLVHTFGDDYVTRHMQLCQEAIDDIEVASQATDFDTEFTRRNTLYYVSEEADEIRLREECRWLLERGAPVEWVSEDWIRDHYSFEKQGAIYSRNDGELNPFTFTHGLIEFASNKGVSVFEHTEMVGVHSHDNAQIITVKGGHTIRAKQVIYAAGYEDMDIVKEKKARFVSTYTVTTTPVDSFPGWHERTLIWETARPYIYIRTTKDQRIVIGGLDEDTDIAEERDAKRIHKRDQLMQELHARFPEIDTEPAFYSAAFYGGSVDGLPMVGMYEEHPNSYFVMGYGDNGLVYSMILAKLIRNHLVTGQSEDLQLYELDRPLKKSRLYK